MTESGAFESWVAQDERIHQSGIDAAVPVALKKAADFAEQIAIVNGDERVILRVLERPETVPALAVYLESVRIFLTRYVAFPSEHEAIAIALWIAHAHMVDRFETSPILAITSAELRSGKTRTLDCLELLAPYPFRVVIPSEAVTYTVLNQRPRRTMLLDEADAIFGPRTAERYEGLRAVLNAGNRQGTPVLRVKLEGRRREVEEFDVFGPKAIAGIGKLPDTVADRAIPIRLKRRAPSEPIAKFRNRVARAEAEAIGRPPKVDTLTTDAPVPDELNDRAADAWEPLVAIALAAGDGWPARARLAALALSSDDDREVSAGMRLLADIRDAFDEHLASHLPTATLLEYLRELEDGPWGEWYGKPLSARGLARLLEPYRVLPLNRRLGGKMTRGYFRAEFEDAWIRYVPLPESVASVASVAASTAATDETDATVPGEESVDDLLEQVDLWRQGSEPEPELPR